ATAQGLAEDARDAAIAALDLKAPLASPSLTGTPTAPTPNSEDNSTKIATTAFVKSNGVVILTQAEYDALTPNTATLYVITA
ncbi:MAG: hypothetical protein RI826_10480, partial [Chlorobium phaeovibrioides]|nr:hypothetical protein [Chlorobium phaeovibrioides]